jgi:hypothetical protein
MSRRKTPRRDWKMTLFLIVSLLIVLSMVLGSVIVAFQN